MRLTRRRPAPRLARYGGQNRVVVDLPNDCYVIAIADDKSLTPSLITEGMYDWPFWRFLHRTLRPGDTAVDVGANIGLFTVAMAACVGPEGRVVAYEPDPTLAGVVRDNLAANFLHHGEVVEAAAADREGSIGFARHERFWGSSSAGVDDLSSHGVADGYIRTTVNAERLDSRDYVSIRLVKIDVEGGEAAALAGMVGLLGRIDYVDVEVIRRNTPDWDALVEALRGLTRAGGTPHVIADDGKLVPTTLDDVIAEGEVPHVVFHFG